MKDTDASKDAQQSQSHESPQNLVGRWDGFGFGCLNANQAQVFANNLQAQVQVGCHRPPVVDYSHNNHLHLGGGGGPYNPWLNTQQDAAFAAHYGHGAIPPHSWAQPQFQAMEQPGLGRGAPGGFFPLQQSHSWPPSQAMEPPAFALGRCSTPASIDSIVFNIPQAQVHSELNMQQPARSHSSSPYPRPTPYGDLVPLVVSVGELEKDPRLKAYIDTDVLKPHYCDDIASSVSSPPPDAGQREEEGGEGRRSPEPEPAPARPKTDLFVFHVPNDMTQKELHNLFSRYGKLRRARIHFHDADESKQSTRQPKGYAFVTFENLSDAVVAVHRLDGYQVSHPNTVAC